MVLGMVYDLAKSQPLVEFRNVGKQYEAGQWAVQSFNCSVERGEFLTFLGPSGSGKTSVLMMLAGFVEPTCGSICLAGRNLDNVPPHRRNMGVVFQNYALFPHMTVAQNVAFPLRIRGMDDAKIRLKTAQALELVQLTGYDRRRTEQLSGGQRQRVALARALVFDPEVVLMDEPLGALDKQLREQLQVEIKAIQSSLGLTVLYVTHDQTEALSLSDRIVVFNDGRVEQIGSPTELYEQPANAFVANFVGHNNHLTGRVEMVSGDRCRIRSGSGVLLDACAADDLCEGDETSFCIRPEHLVLGPAGSHENQLTAILAGKSYFGDHVKLLLRLPGDEVLTAIQWTSRETGTGCLALETRIGSPVQVSWAPERGRAFRRTSAAAEQAA